MGSMEHDKKTAFTLPQRLRFKKKNGAKNAAVLLGLRFKLIYAVETGTWTFVSDRF